MRLACREVMWPFRPITMHTLSDFLGTEVGSSWGSGEVPGGAHFCHPISPQIQVLQGSVCGQIPWPPTSQEMADYLPTPRALQHFYLGRYWVAEMGLSRHLP